MAEKKLKFNGSNWNEVHEFLPEQWSNTSITKKDGTRHYLKAGDTIIKSDDGSLSIES